MIWITLGSVYPTQRLLQVKPEYTRRPEKRRRIEICQPRLSYMDHLGNLGLSAKEKLAEDAVVYASQHGLVRIIGVYVANCHWVFDLRLGGLIACTILRCDGCKLSGKEGSGAIPVRGCWSGISRELHSAFLYLNAFDTLGNPLRWTTTSLRRL
jgi:hypothetical protein